MVSLYPIHSDYHLLALGFFEALMLSLSVGVTYDVKTTGSGFYFLDQFQGQKRHFQGLRDTCQLT